MSSVEYLSLAYSSSCYVLGGIFVPCPNAAATLRIAKNSDHVRPSWQLLHWLPVRAQIEYNVSTVCFIAPQYLFELLHLYTLLSPSVEVSIVALS